MAMDRTFFTAANIDILMKSILGKIADIIDVTVPTAAGTAFTAINTYFGVTTITAFARADSLIPTISRVEITTMIKTAGRLMMP